MRTKVQKYRYKKEHVQFVLYTLLMYCEVYKETRQKYYSLISQSDPIFTQLNDKEKIKYILSADNDARACLVPLFALVVCSSLVRRNFLLIATCLPVGLPL
jgi:hypothetical protein